MKQNIRSIIFYLIAMLALSSCASMSNLRLNVFQPAFVKIPDSIKHVGFINRYLAPKDNKALNVIEGILTGEGIHGDKQGSIAALKAIGDMMNNTKKYNIKVLKPDVVKGVAPEGMPATIDPAVLDKLAHIHQLDGFVVLENFDSDINRHISPSPSPIVLPNGARVPGIRINMEVFATSHWRFYDARNKSIIDQFSGQGFVAYDVDAVTQLLATGKLPMAKDAVGIAGKKAGEKYAWRITDHYVWVGRSYYKRGSDYIKQAARMVITKDWDEASVIWKKEAESSKAKTASRALYNLALYYEVKGNLNAAIQSAETCYKQYAHKKALWYSKVLKNRQKALMASNAE